MSAVLREPLKHHLIDSNAYLRLGELGILGADERVELIAGQIFDTPPVGCEHAGTVGFLTQKLTTAVMTNGLVFVQNPVVLPPDSVPNPDVAVLRPQQHYYRGQHPQPEDVLLIVEVADSTLTTDRDLKIPLYGRHGVPEAWLVDLQNQRLHIFTKPFAKGYLESRSYAEPGVVGVGTIAGCQVDLSGLFET